MAIVIIALGVLSLKGTSHVDNAQLGIIPAKKNMSLASKSNLINVTKNSVTVSLDALYLEGSKNREPPLKDVQV